MVKTTTSPPPADDADAALGWRIRAAAALPEVPPRLVDAAHAAWRWRLAQAQPSLGQRLAAALRLDSWALTPAQAGLRGVGAPRQLIYHAADCDLDLRLYGGAIAGQVMGDTQSTALALQAADADEPGWFAAPDALGEFRFEALPPGRYTLHWRQGDHSVSVSDLDVPAT